VTIYAPVPLTTTPIEKGGVMNIGACNTQRSREKTRRDGINSEQDGLHSRIHVRANCLSTELHLQVVLEVSSRADKLDVCAVRNNQFLLLQSSVLFTVNVGESPLLRNDDLLSSGELVSCPPECLHDSRGVRVFRADRQDNLTNVHTGDSAVRLAPRSSHTSLQPIRSSAGQHLVDANDVEGVDADTHVEGVFSGCLGDVFVGTDTGGFERFGGELFVFI